MLESSPIWAQECQSKKSCAQSLSDLNLPNKDLSKQKKNKSAEDWYIVFGKAAGLQLILFPLRTFLMLNLFRNCEVICYLQRTGSSLVLLRFS